MRKSKKKSWLSRTIKRAVATSLLVSMVMTSTSIPEALIRSGLIDYLGIVGQNFREYFRVHSAQARDVEGDIDSSSKPQDTVTTIINNITNENDNRTIINHNCDHTTVNDKLNSLDDTVAAIKGVLGDSLGSDVEKAKEDIEKILKDCDVIKDKQIPHIISALFATTSDVDENGNPKNPDDVASWIGGMSVSNILLYYSDLMEMWFEYGNIAGPTGELSDEQKANLSEYYLTTENDKLDAYNFYMIADNISSTRKTLQLGLGYTDSQGDLLESVNPETGEVVLERFWDKDKLFDQLTDGTSPFLEVTREQRTLSGEVSNIFYSMIDNFGYWCYAYEKYDPEKYHWSTWDPSIARDFRQLLEMFKEYRVAHVYSMNCELEAPWQPTPEELNYAKERVLNKGYANAYLGFWQEAAADNAGYENANTRFQQVLGEDILTSAETYVYDVIYTPIPVKKYDKDNNPVLDENGNQVVEEKPNWVIDGEHLVETMDITESINLSDACRILYRALGQDVVTYTIGTFTDPNIQLETSPCSVGLPNPRALLGDSVYVGVHRNNQLVLTYHSKFKDNKDSKDAEMRAIPEVFKTVSVTDFYLEKAKQDGLVSKGYDHKSASQYYMTNSEFWVLASEMMRLYGEPEMNSTEILSMLQVYGSSYPIQAGNQIADAWAYLKARGILYQESDNVASFMSAEDALNIAMRIKDKDSRYNYKEINLTVELSQAVVDNGFFPLVNDNVEVVENYNTTVEYDYESAETYNIVIPIKERLTGVTPEVYAIVDDNTDGVLVEDNKFKVTVQSEGLLHLLLDIPYAREDLKGVRVVYGGKDIPNSVELRLSNTDLSKAGYYDGERKDIIPFDDSSLDKYDEAFMPYVDHVRHKAVPKFNQAAYNASFGERVAFFFKYVFTPTTAYAAAEQDVTSGSPITAGSGGGAALKYKITTKVTNPTAMALAVLYPYTSEKAWEEVHNDSMYGKYDMTKTFVQKLTNKSTIANNHLVGVGTGPDDRFGAGSNWGSSYRSLTSLHQTEKMGGGYYLKYLVNYAEGYSALWANGTFKDGGSMNIPWLDIRNASKGTTYSDFSGPQYHIFQDLTGFVSSTSSNSKAYTYGVKLACTSDPNSNCIEITIEGTDDIKMQNLLSLLEAGDSGLKKEQSNTANTDGIKVEESGESSSGSTQGSIEEVNKMNPSQIMNRNADMYISYQTLLEKGLVQTKREPKPDKNGVLSFYLTEKGQVIIDTVNNTVSVNAVYLNLDKIITPVYFANDGLYINYVCLVGALATYEIPESEVTDKTVTATGSGKNAVYKLATGLEASEETETVKKPLRNVENQTKSGVYSHLISEYKGTALYASTAEPDNDDELAMLGSQKLMMLTSVFPTANWVIVEGSTSSYLYVFYNRKMFDYSYKGDDGAIISYWQNEVDTPGVTKVNPGKYCWQADVDSDKEFTDERNLIRRVKVGEDTVISKIVATYGMDEASTANIGILQSTYDALCSLAKETGTLIANQDFLVRRFSIPYKTDLGDIKEGDVVFLDKVGYVYCLPQKYDHSKYVAGEHRLPYVYSRSEIVEYNLNTYGNASTPGNGPQDMPYGYTIRTDSADDKVKFEWMLGDYTPKQSSGNSDRFHLTGDLIATDYSVKINNEEDTSCILVAPTGLFKKISTVASDEVRISTLSLYTTTQCYFYLGTKRLKHVPTDTVGSELTSFNLYDGQASPDSPLFRIDGDGLATVTTRDYYGRHHFSLSPNMAVFNAVQINAVDATDYAIDYSDNPFYTGIKVWISGLDDATSMALYILFYVVPYIMLIWILLLVALALLPNNFVLGISRLIGVDIVSILTIGRREAIQWRGWRVVVPLLIAFVAMGLFYGPNLLRIIEIVSGWCYSLSGLA